MNHVEDKLPRTKVHTRNIEINGYKCTDDRWEIEGHLTDVRHHDIPLPTGTRLAGQPLHEMVVCLTVDDQLNIHAVTAETRASPYPGTCENVTPEYGKLVGQSIQTGFRREVVRLFGGTKGCTHITELLGAMATAAVQTVGPEVEMKSGERPRKLDGCHALDTAGSVVANHFPTWHRKDD
jgi:hypothetical protein